MKRQVGQDHHLILEVSDQLLKGGVRHVRGGIIRGHDRATLIDDVARLSPQNPAMVEVTFAAERLLFSEY